jgi:hypothetical protein
LNLKELSLHILDIAENSLSAKANEIEIAIEESIKKDFLTIYIRDNGVGMDAEKVSRLADPFFTSRTTRKVGLGIPLLKEAAEACNGSLGVVSQPGVGTEITVNFQRNHIDRMPLGDLAGTFLGLIIGSPDIRWRLDYDKDDENFHLDTAEVIRELDGIPLNEPLVIKWLKSTLQEGINRVQSA